MAKLDDLIQQKQQRDEDWKAKKTEMRGCIYFGHS